MRRRGTRRPHPVSGDRHRPPGVRDRFGAGGEQRPAPLLRSRGGVLVVQYQQHLFFEGGFAPLPLTVGGPPLTVSADTLHSSGGTNGTGPVPDSTARPLSPRPRGGRDRPGDGPGSRPPGAAAAQPDFGAATGRLDPRARSLLRAELGPGVPAAHRDTRPGEAELRGTCHLSSWAGTYVYTGLSFFRQLPAGNPGALRLFVNLLALGQRPTR